MPPPPPRQLPRQFPLDHCPHRTILLPHPLDNYPQSLSSSDNCQTVNSPSRVRARVRLFISLFKKIVDYHEINTENSYSLEDPHGKMETGKTEFLQTNSFEKMAPMKTSLD